MKRIFAYAAAALAFAGVMTSCSNENDPVSPAGDEVNASFTLQLPSELQQTRAYGDGLKALTLNYGIYEKNTTTGAVTLVGDAPRTATFSSLTATINVPLVTGKDYRLVFWGYDDACTAYTLTWPADGNPTVAVSYAGVKQNDETRDAFYNYADIHVSGPVNETVYLYRPFAQINFGTGDTTADAVTSAFGADLAKIQTKLVTKAYTNLDLVTGAVTGQTDVTFDLNSVPAASEKFPYQPDNYRYLSMDYLLVPADKSTVDCMFDIYSEGNPTALNTLNIKDVPVQRNYQTNIFGQLLTSNSNFNVIIEPTFNEPDYNVWMGGAIKPKPDADGNYSIGSPAELAGLAQIVAGGNALANKTVTLTADVDLNNIEWQPIGTPDVPFSGTFDGGNHTIKNLKISGTGTWKPTGFIGIASNGSSVKNLNIDGADINMLGCTTDDSGYGTGVAVGSGISSIANVHVSNAIVKAYHYGGGVVGYSYSNVEDCSAENVNVILSYEEESSGAYGSADKAGAILGYQGEGAATLSGNVVKNCQVTAYRNVGGAFGYINEGTKVIKNNTVSNTTVTQIFEHNYKGYTPGQHIGKIWGDNYAAFAGTNNTATEVTLVIPDK